MNRKLGVEKIDQLSIEMAGGCNLKCPMCPQSKGREKDFKKILPLEIFKSAVDQAMPMGLKYVILSGSGEPLLHKQLEEAVAYLTQNKIVSMIYTNWILMTPERFEKLCQAGLTICKVSCQGWDRKSYAYWMSKDNFDKVRANLKQSIEILRKKKYDTYLQTNHLIHDFNQLQYQKEMYLKNWIYYLGLPGEIWMDHNWAGFYDASSIERNKIYAKRERRSCGRPLANVVEIRAGGLGEKRGAVVPCPIVLGQDSKAVMGHLEDMTLKDILNGSKYSELRDAHLRGAFDEIDYCKNCDQLLDVAESLVWTNIPKRTYGQSRISNIDYIEASKRH